MISPASNAKNISFNFINWTGLLFLSVTLIGYFFKSPNFLQVGLKEVLIYDYVFLNILHVPITLFLLFTIPEFKTWLNVKPSVFGRFKLEIFAAALFFFVLSFFGDQIGLDYARPKQIGNFHILFLYQILFCTLSSFHSNGQIYGLTCILNNDGDPGRIRPLFLVFERFLFKILPICYGIRLFQFFILISAEDPKLYYPRFFAYNYFLLCFSSIAIFINSFLIFRRLEFTKILFSSRTLIAPLVGDVPFAIFARAANHGIENFLVQKNIIDRQPNSKKLYFGLVLVMTVWGLLVLPRYFSMKSYLDVHLLTLYLAIITTIDLLHFWLERAIYRMRDPLSLKHISPLIKR